MSKLESMQRAAERAAHKLGIEVAVSVQWAPGKGKCKLRRLELAHAHYRGPERGLIHIRRGLKDWRDAIKHEVAHFVPGARHDSTSFLRARASQGSLPARAALAQRGKGRCPGHEWYDFALLSNTITRRGRIRITQVACRVCGKRQPA